MKTKKKGLIITIVVVLLVIIGAFLVLFFNRSFDVTFTNLDTAVVVKVKYNNQIPHSKIETKEQLGEDFIGWYEVTRDKENKEIVAKEAFNFDNKITRKVELKAIYKGASNEEMMTVTFDSNGGTKVASITFKKGEALNLPPNPTRSGYTFVRWEDRHATPIYNGALIDGDITLKAIWEKNAVKKITYTCPSGYTLDGTKCNKTVNALSKCPADTKTYNDKCILVTYSSRTEPEKACGSKTVHVGNGHTVSFEGELFKLGTSFCFYGVVTDSYEQQNSTNCTNRGHKWNSENSKCYYDRDDANVNITSVCKDPKTILIDPYSLFGSTLNAGCYPIKGREYYCNEGTLVGKNCKITIDATKK